MKIENISISNFENLDGLYQFGQVTELRGRNGCGKSAVGRAIGWCFTGLDAYGDRRTDHVLRDVKQPAEVVMRLADGRTVMRRKTLHSTQLLVNGAPVELDHFGDPHLLLSSFMPGYFLTLDEKQKRQLFMQLLPPVDMVDLFTKRTDLDLKVQEAMGIDFRQDPVKLHKRWATTRLAKQKEFQQLEGAKGELELRVQELEKRLAEAREAKDSQDLDALEKSGKAKATDLEQARAQLKAWQEWRAAFDERAKRAEDRKRWEDQVAEALGGMTPAGLHQEFKKAEQALERLQLKRDKWKQWQWKVKELKDAEKEHADKLALLDTGQCYTCKQPLKGQDLKAVRSQLLSVPEPGKEPPSVTDEDMLKAQQERDLLHDRLSVGRDCQQFLDSRPLPKDPGPEPEAPTQETVNGIAEELQLHREAFAAAKAAQKAGVESLEKELDKAKQDLEANQQLRTETAVQVDRLQAIEAALHPASGVFADALKQQLETVRELLPAWEFELSETTKTTGNEKPCFHEYLDVPVNGDPGRFWRVPLRYCSAGQQLAAGVDLCRALDHLNGGKLGMVFVDNVELLSRELPLHGDVQEFRCVVEDQDLTVNVLVPA